MQPKSSYKIFNYHKIFSHRQSYLLSQIITDISTAASYTLDLEHFDIKQMPLANVWLVVYAGL